MLQDLEENQIQDFITRWHDLTFTDQADKQRKRERLQRAIDTSKAIRELAGNPLLLTMMAILNRNQELPRDRPELYNQASRVLLHQWDVERALVEHQQLEIQTIDYKDKQAMLRQVAYQMQAAEKGLAGNLIAADELEGILNKYLQTLDINDSRAVARVMIKQLRERNFILCFMGADYYAFVHRTFLEYFCAWEYVWQFEKERTISLEELKTKVFGKHWQDEFWHEVLRLIVGMIEPKLAGEIIDYLIDKDGEKENFLNLFLAADCLGEVGSRSGLVLTYTRLLRDLKGLTKYRSNDWLNLPYADANLILGIRGKAVAAIATIWKDAPETLPWLKTCALSDSDKDVDIRMSALEELAKGWRDDPDTLSIIKNCTLSDNHPSVQNTAVMMLARYWQDKPDTVVLLKEKAQYDNSWVVRKTAVQELAEGWKDEPWLFELLRDRALNDPFVREDDLQFHPRQLALKIIIKQYPDHPQTLPLLRDRAENDPDDKVRNFAQNKLAKLEKKKRYMI
jgi:predicted NACHT family NTPase